MGDLNVAVMQAVSRTPGGYLIDMERTGIVWQG